MSIINTDTRVLYYINIRNIDANYINIQTQTLESYTTSTSQIQTLESYITSSQIQTLESYTTSTSQTQPLESYTTPTSQTQTLRVLYY